MRGRGREEKSEECILGLVIAGSKSTPCHSRVSNRGAFTMIGQFYVSVGRDCIVVLFNNPQIHYELHYLQPLLVKMRCSKEKERARLLFEEDNGDDGMMINVDKILMVDERPWKGTRT